MSANNSIKRNDNKVTRVRICINNQNRQNPKGKTGGSMKKQMLIPIRTRKETENQCEVCFLNFFYDMSSNTDYTY